MAKGRKNGCPTNIRDWQISILDQEAGGEWVRINGLRTLTRTIESETADGSAGCDLWEEPYVTKRAATLKLNGRAVGCVASGDMDRGQQLLDEYAEKAGCEGDAALRFVDPYGHAMEADFIVAGAEKTSSDTENTVAWELKQVGEAEALPYIPVREVALEESALTLAVGGTETVRFTFVPENASNQRFRVRVNDPATVAVSNIGPGCFDVSALKAGEATVTVISMNGRKTAALTVTAEDAE